MKRILMAFVAAILFATILSGCGSKPSPTQTVDRFLKAFRSNDFNKASKYVDSQNNSSIMNFKNLKRSNGVDSRKLLKAITKGYRYKKPQLVSSSQNSAKVKVKITSVDFGTVVEKTVGQSLSLAFANAFGDNNKKSLKKMNELLSKSLIDQLSSHSAPMATREVTLDLKKEKSGSYQIISNKNLLNAILANAANLKNLYGN